MTMQMVSIEKMWCPSTLSIKNKSKIQLGAKVQEWFAFYDIILGYFDPVKVQLTLFYMAQGYDHHSR